LLRVEYFDRTVRRGAQCPIKFVAVAARYLIPPQNPQVPNGFVLIATRTLQMLKAGHLRRRKKGRMRIRASVREPFCCMCRDVLQNVSCTKKSSTGVADFPETAFFLGINAGRMPC